MEFNQKKKKKNRKWVAVAFFQETSHFEKLTSLVTILQWKTNTMCWIVTRPLESD